MVERLVSGPRSVSELAEPFDMSLAAIGQHVQLLESSGLVRTEKVGRVRHVELSRETLQGAERWFAAHRARWETRFDRLGAMLREGHDRGDHATTATTRKPKKRKR